MAAAAGVVGAGVIGPAVEESKSLLATITGQLITIVRQIVDAVLKVSSRIIEFASKHPLALVLLVSNLVIWVSA